jgi:hypothetical protein
MGERRGGPLAQPGPVQPLNTTQPEPDATSTNPAGVKSYTSWDQGLTATVSTLMNGRYSDILSALATGSSAQDVVSAVTSSPWGTKTITLANGTTAGGTDTTAVDAGYSVPGAATLGNLALKLAFVGGAVVLVALGLLRGTAAGRAYGDHLKQGAELAATVA